jgi:GT2 family glycosyltransferase
MAIGTELFLSLGGFPEHYAGYFDDVESVPPA